MTQLSSVMYRPGSTLLHGLDSAVKLSIEHSFDYIVSKGCAIHPNTLAAYKELKTINKRISLMHDFIWMFHCT